MTALGIMALSMNYFNQLHIRKQVQRINRIEGFYLGELLAWHQRYKSKTEPGESESNEVVKIEPRIDAELPESLAEIPIRQRVTNLGCRSM
jgi:hypothetical protein